jgi:hypothetical protein
VATLKEDGYGVVEPVEGLALSDGRPTVGAMPEIEEIVAWAARFLDERRRASAPLPSDLLTHQPLNVPEHAR